MTKQEKRILKYAELFRVKPGSKVTLAKDFDPGFKAECEEEGRRRLLRRGIALLADYQARLAAQDTYGVLVCSRRSTPAARTGRSAT